MLLLLGLLPGCITIHDKDGVTYTLIVGFGMVRTKDASDGAVVATDTRSFGLVVSDQPAVKLGVGYASSTVVTVPVGAENVCIEVSRKPFGPFVVEAPATAAAPGAQSPKEK